MHRDLYQRVTCYLQLLLLLVFTRLYSACPPDCVCLWKGGKQKIECINRGLRTFPGPIDPNTQVLDLTGNSFETLPPDHFMRLGLINLQKVYLSKCRLSHISPRTFRGLSNLVDLDLSYNVMREVPSGAFPDCQGLMRLILSGNPIQRIQRNAFISLESLTTLEISNAGIELIEKGALDGLVSLEWLKLNGNKLKRISGLTSLPPGLKGIWLEDNPWECDCYLLELRLWLAERNVANSVEPRCLTPARLTNSSLKELSTDNFACLPQLSPTTMYQKIGEGKNVTLLCKAMSIPEASLEWWFNGQPLANSSLSNYFVDSSISMATSSSSSTSSSSNSGFQSNLSTNNNKNFNNNNNINYNSNENLNNYNSNTNYYNSNNNNNQNSNSNTQSSSQHVGGNLNGGVEKRSELTIFNVTGDENGTFSCVARNPAGAAVANYTVFFVRSDTDTLTESTVTSLVGSYSNILVVVVSTVGVIGVVILLVLLTVGACKCSRLCRLDRNSNSSPNSQQRSKQISSSRSAKDSKDTSTTGCAGKMNRHLSEASTLTTATKSNGSVFLLSTSSELGIGDSNPDLIEGVASVSGKRVEGDGHETSFTSASNNFHGNSVYPSPEPSANPTSLEPFPPIAVYPIDYGLPKSLNVNTLVRRSPSAYTTTTTTATSIPPNYDLAKYPKEYINPTPMISCGQHIYQSAPPPQSHPHHGLMYGPGPSGEYYPAYAMVAPDGSFIYNATPDDYYMGLTMGYVGSMPPGVVVTSGPPANCTCAPILEQSEEEKAAVEAAEAETESIMSSGTVDNTMPMSASTTTATRNPNNIEDSTASRVGTLDRGKRRVVSTETEGTTTTSTATGEPGMVARLQRQLKTQINESPDEGYEDESAEGTEI